MRWSVTSQMDGVGQIVLNWTDGCPVALSEWNGRFCMSSAALRESVSCF